MLAAAAGLSSSRVHQLVAGADLDALDAVLASCGQRAGQPRESRPREDTELGGRDTMPTGYPMR